MGKASSMSSHEVVVCAARLLSSVVSLCLTVCYLSPSGPVSQLNGEQGWGRTYCVQPHCPSPRGFLNQ